jgi:hypothetical protein
VVAYFALICGYCTSHQKMTQHFMFFHCGCLFCTHMCVLHKPPKTDSTFHVFSLWMPILHSYVGIAQATKKWLNISCFFIVDAYFALICAYCTSHQKMTQHFMFFHCGCLFGTHMWVLHKPPKNDSTFHVYVGIDNMPKKPTSFLWAQCKYCNIEQKTNAYYWITCGNCKLNPGNPMHTLWLSCKYCNYNHIGRVVNSYLVLH